MSSPVVTIDAEHREDLRLVLQRKAGSCLAFRGSQSLAQRSFYLENLLLVREVLVVHADHVLVVDVVHISHGRHFGLKKMRIFFIFIKFYFFLKVS